MRPVVLVKLSLLNILLSFTSASAFHLRMIGRYEGAEKKAVAKDANTNMARRYGIGRFLIKLTTEQSEETVASQYIIGDIFKLFHLCAKVFFPDLFALFFVQVQVARNPPLEVVLQIRTVLPPICL